MRHCCPNRLAPIARHASSLRTRYSLGNASKTWRKEGEVDLSNITLIEGDEGYCHDWYAAIHPLMGKEGHMAGLYMVRPSFEDTNNSMMKDERMGFKIGSKASVQLKNSSAKDFTSGLQLARRRGERLSALDDSSSSSKEPWYLNVSCQYS